MLGLRRLTRTLRDEDRLFLRWSLPAKNYTPYIFSLAARGFECSCVADCFGLWGSRPILVLLWLGVLLVL